MNEFIEYPKIHDTKNCPGGQCIMFEKLDGSNLGWVWTRDAGWLGQTTRRQEFGKDHPTLGEAIPVFYEIFAGVLGKILGSHKLFSNSSHAKVFTEFLGPSSFAGLHVPGEPKRLVLIDVWAENVGFVGPQEFLSLFAELPLPKVLFRGKFTGMLTLDVKDGKFSVKEGAVVKGGQTGDVWMCKVKTKSWIERLERAFTEGYWTDAAGIQRSVREESDF